MSLWSRPDHSDPEIASHLSDEELVTRSRADSKGTGAWIEELFGRYHSRVALWCLRFTGDRDSAADLAQDVFLKAHRNLSFFRGDAKFSTWLYSIARNHCVNDMKARALRPANTGMEMDLRDDKQPSIAAVLEKQESLEAMRVLMGETLDETERTVMTLHYADEVSLDVITRLLSLSNPSGARAYIVSAKRKLAIAVKRWNARHHPGGQKERYGEL